MPENNEQVSTYRSDIRQKQREATRLCIELGLAGSEEDDARVLQGIAKRLDRVLVELKTG